MIKLLNISCEYKLGNFVKVHLKITLKVSLKRRGSFIPKSLCFTSNSPQEKMSVISLLTIHNTSETEAAGRRRDVIMEKKIFI